MIRIFTTGDNHIGLKYSSHERAESLVASRIRAFENMVEAANKENCSLFVITGDLFENTYGISKKEIKVLLEMLSKFRGTVAVLPGNHDYYDKEVKVWRYFEEVMGDYDSIMLLKEYRPYVVQVEDEKVILYPALCTSLHSVQGENNLSWMKEENIVAEEAYHIGIVHGAVEGESLDKEGQYFLMSRAELENIPMDVWLIGHTHVPFPRNLTEEYTVCEKILNAGTHVQTDVSCNTEGQCFFVEIDKDKQVRGKKFVSGNLRFYRKNICLVPGKMEEILHEELKNIEDNSVVELIISGAVEADEYDKRSAVIEESLSRFIEGTYSDYDLSKLISKELIESEFPETSFSAKFLSELLVDAKEAQLAYELLKNLKQGK